MSLKNLRDQFHPPAVDIHSSRTDLDHLLVLHQVKRQNFTNVGIQNETIMIIYNI